ncbi:MAG: acetyltransferase [Solirubrobacterales bacterium]|nr:acetyltransferase [Solirubrobacterales bacterium]
MEFRPGGPEDYERLTAIWKAAVEATHDFVTAEEIAGYEARMPVDFLPAVELTVATIDDEPVGFLGMGGDNIEMLFVDPGRHGQGIGRALVDRVGDRPRLTVDVNEENMGAVAFYWKLGFKPTGRSETDADGAPHPLIHLELTN